MRNIPMPSSNEVPVIGLYTASSVGGNRLIYVLTKPRAACNKIIEVNIFT